MAVKYHFRPFNFFPVNLHEERKRIEKKYEYAQERAFQARVKRRLPKLLEKIRTLPMSNEHIDTFARQRSKAEMRMLMHDYPYTQENKQTVHKIERILITGYTTEIGRLAWRRFQEYYKDAFLIRLLKLAFQKEDETFLGLDSESRAQLYQGARSKSFFDQLVYFLIHSGELAETKIKKWKVKQDTLLAEQLILAMFIEGLKEDRIIEREGISTIKDYLESYTLESYKKVFKSYVSSRDYSAFHIPLMFQSIERLGDPRTDDRPWQFLSEDKINQVKTWLMHNELKRFFEHNSDNERFLYWEKYTNELKEVEIVEKPSIVFMDFGEFVVVEFGNIGAAYIYHREGFYKYIQPRKYGGIFTTSRSNQRKESLFKDRTEYGKNGEKLYIHRLLHQGSWFHKFDNHMRAYLAGDFFYKY